MIYKTGTIVLIPFPFSDLTGLKQRLALIVSSEESQRETRQIICMMVTSTKSIYSTDYILSSWKESGLLKPSVVKVNRIFTINADLVKRSMGELSVKDAENIKAILFRILEHSNKKD